MFSHLKTHGDSSSNEIKKTFNKHTLLLMRLFTYLHSLEHGQDLGVLQRRLWNH